ncbi:MAG: hypothetical protein M1114_06595 [Candidatus Dependentiae bacterium]|nr:hypothetical protein [Candidatus Dependentiae bacterium]
MKYSQFLLSAFAATSMINAIDFSHLKNDFTENLKQEAHRAPFKNASQIPLNKKGHFSIKMNFGKKTPTFTFLNDEMASAIIVDAAVSTHNAKKAGLPAKEIGIKVANQMGKTYCVEQLVAAMAWFANKAQETTGIKTPAAVKSALENEYVAWLANAAVKTVARAAVDTAIANFPSMPGTRTTIVVEGLNPANPGETPNPLAD